MPEKSRNITQNSLAAPDGSIMGRLRAFSAKGGKAGEAQWLNGLVLRLRENRLHVSFAHAYFPSWFMPLKKKEFEKLARAALGMPNLEFAYEAPNSAAAPPPAESAGERGREDKGLFDAFISNEKNSLALEAAKSMAREALAAGEKQARLLLLCGPSGSGKSHLLGAIHATYSASPRFALLRKAAFFCSGHKRDGLSEILRTFWQDRQILLLDDLQEVFGQKSWQFLLRAYVDAALSLNAARGLAFAMGGAENQLNGLEPGLRSRLESGLILELEAPDLDIRLRWLEKLNKEEKLAFNREQIIFIARRCRHIPQMRGLLRKIEIFVKLYGRNPTLRDMEDLASTGGAAPPPGWRDIVDKVASRFNLKAEEIINSGRRPDLVLARQVAMYVCRRKLGFSFPELGRIFGGKDHSTVMHGIRKVQSLADADRDMRKLLTELENESG